MRIMKTSIPKAALAAFVFASLFGVADAAARKPNIIFIMVDDMGYHDLGCYGSTTIQTPRIDKMRAEGIKFTDCYSGAPVCAPARSTLMTGTHMGRTPVRGNSGGIPLFPEDVTIAELLKKAGYVCGGFGKWGLGNQGMDGAAERQGFDIFYGYYNQWHAHDYYKPLYRNSVKENVEEKYTHYLIADEGLKFIRENKDNPFFMYCCWTPPHAKYQIPEDDPAVALYKDKDWSSTEKVVAAMDSMIDRDVGRILDLLKELKNDDDTIVFFTSDNGSAMKGNGGVHKSCGIMKGRKGSLNEGGIRVPMVVRWPDRIEADRESDLPWYFPDVMPTLAELAGLSAKDVPEEIDGISIVPTLLNKGEQKEHEYMYWCGRDGGSGVVRVGNFKGFRRGDSVLLYDLIDDRREKKNVANEHPELVARMLGYMKEAYREPRSQLDDSTKLRLEMEAKGLGKKKGRKKQ